MDAPRQLAELAARLLRHEVGDLLQTVYATAVLLQQRLGPAAKQERQLLADLRNRAETCKHELDAVHDLICPPEMDCAPLDLAELVHPLAESIAVRFPVLEVRAKAGDSMEVLADERWLSQAVTFLLLNACQSARVRVALTVTADPARAEVALTIRDDGPGFSAEQLEWLTAPFSTTREARVGLGLALARRVAEASGGSVEATNLSGGGKQVALILPAAPPLNGGRLDGPSPAR